MPTMWTSWRAASFRRAAIRPSSEWRAYARTFLCAVLRRSREGGSRSASELWRLLSAASPEELRPVVAGTPAQPFLEGENARMFGSIRSVAVSAMAAFEYVQRQRAAPFSVRQWVRRRSAPGVLFMPYKAGQIAALRSIIATWMRLAIFEALSAEENRDQRLWIVDRRAGRIGRHRRTQGRARTAPKIRRPLRVWAFSRSPRSPVRMERATRRPSSKTAATRSYCAARAARTAARRNSPLG